MSDASSAVKHLRERLTASEDHLGKALFDLLDNPLLTGTIGRAFDAREKAAQAQELAMGALNIPSAADIERLTRRLRSVSQRLEGIEDGVHRLDRALGARSVETRLSKIEEQLETLTDHLDKTSAPSGPRASAPPKAVPSRGGTPVPSRASASSKSGSPPKAAPASRAKRAKRGTTGSKPASP